MNNPAHPSKDPNEFAKMILTTSKDEVYLQCPHLTAHAKKATDFTATLADENIGMAVRRQSGARMPETQRVKKQPHRKCIPEVDAFCVLHF
jgi:hypothetical protein